MLSANATPRQVFAGRAHSKPQILIVIVLSRYYGNPLRPVSPFSDCANNMAENPLRRGGESGRISAGVNSFALDLQRGWKFGVRATPHAPHLPYAVPHEPLDEGVLGITFMVRSGGNGFDRDVLFSANPVGAGYRMDPYLGCDVVAEPAPTNGYSFFLVDRFVRPDGGEGT